MGSPVTSEDFTPVTPSSSLCDGFRALLRTPALMRTFLDWLLDDSGNVSMEAADSMADYLTPIGTIVMWGGTSLPSTKWQVCSGQAVSRTEFATLFQRYGTAWGSGDGSSTFNVPDMRDRIPIGTGSIVGVAATAGSRTKTLTIGNLPAHSHTMVFKRSSPDTGPDDLFSTGNDPGDYDDQTKTSSEVGSGDPLDVLNPVTGLFFIIKVS